MLTRQNSSNLESDIPSVDEGWWASVLSDEAINHKKNYDSNQKPVIPQKLNGVDWKHVRGIFENDEIITLEVYNFNRGGLLVEGNGIQGFVPVSHLVDMPNNICDEERQQKLNNYIGTSLNLKVIECESNQERIVFSERAALAGEGQRKLLFSSLTPGEIVSGTITNITDFGVFVDLGGVEGLIHVSELSWGRVRHPMDIVQLNQVINAQVLQISEDSGRVALSLKQLSSNPWEDFSNEHHCDDIVPATITAITKYGVFARLKVGIEGLIHISSMDLPEGEQNLHKSFHSGQKIQVQIINIDAERRRLGLGLVSME